MKIYFYSHETGELAGAGLADPDPMAAGEFLHPAFSTPVAPPVCGANQVPLFHGDAWLIVADHRGEVWFAGDGSHSEIVALGEPSLLGLSPTAPPASPPTVIELAAYNAAARWRKEIAGVAWGGHVIDTNRENGQAKLLAEFVAITAGMRADPSPWKFLGDDWVDLSNADMGAVCLAARDHIAAQFSIERSVKAAIDAGTVTTFAEIDAAFA